MKKKFNPEWWNIYISWNQALSLLSKYHNRIILEVSNLFLYKIIKSGVGIVLNNTFFFIEQHDISYLKVKGSLPNDLANHWTYLVFLYIKAFHKCRIVWNYLGEGKVFCLPFELSFLLLGLLQAKYLLRSRLLGIRAWSLLDGEEKERGWYGLWK